MFLLFAPFDPKDIEVLDIRELISLEDVMEELQLGPNGGLIYCMEYPFPEICDEVFSEYRYSTSAHSLNYLLGI